MAVFRQSLELEVIRKDAALDVSRCDGGEVGGEAAYQVVLDTSKLGSHFRSVIVCKVSGTEDIQEIPVSATISEGKGITIVPSIVRWPTNLAGLSEDRFVFVLNNDGKVLDDPIRVEVPDGLSLDFEKTKSPSRLRIKIKAKPDMAPVSPSKSTIRLFFEGIEEAAPFEVVQP